MSDNEAPLARNDKYNSDIPTTPLTQVEYNYLLTLALVELARVRGVELTGEFVDVFSRARGHLGHAANYRAVVVKHATFGSIDDDIIALSVKRVTEPVTTDDSLVTSPTATDQLTNDQGVT